MLPQQKGPFLCYFMYVLMVETIMTWGIKDIEYAQQTQDIFY